LLKRQRERERGKVGTFAGYTSSSRRGGNYVDTDDDYEDLDEYDDDFIDDGDDDLDWQAQLRKMTKYDPTKFKDDFDDRLMEASWNEVQAEERKSLRMGRAEDEKAEAEEARRMAEKAAAKKRKRSGGLFDD